MRDEPDYEQDATYRECSQCGDEISAGYLLHGLPVCHRCYTYSPVVQAVLEQDRKADDEDDEQGYGHGV